MACTEKWLAKICQEMYFQNARKKGFKQVLERFVGVSGFSKTESCFGQKKVDQKSANRDEEQLFERSAASFGMNSSCSPSSGVACYGGRTSCRVSRRLVILADEVDFK
jgi:hypothetical protein